MFSVDPQQVSDHYYQFVYSSGGYAPRRCFLHLIWLSGILVLWNERNQRHFTNSAKTSEQLFEKVKITSLRWLKAKNVWFPFGYHMWWQRPLACLGIGWFTFHCCLLWLCSEHFCNLVLFPLTLLMLGIKTFC